MNTNRIKALLLSAIMAFPGMAQSQELTAWGNSFQMVYMKEEKTISISHKYYIHIDFEKETAVLNMGDKGYLFEPIDRVINYHKKDIMKVILKSGVVIILQKGSIVMADPEDSNTVLYFDVDNKNSIIKE